jgi:choline-glycine betaine transporter
MEVAMAIEVEHKTAVASTAALEVPLQIAIPVAKIVPWAIFGIVVMALAYYFVGAEQGATSVFNGMGVHEFVHDARHLLGFPCH